LPQDIIFHAKKREVAADSSHFISIIDDMDEFGG
jgi:hypothetical protein